MICKELLAKSWRQQENKRRTLFSGCAQKQKACDEQAFLAVCFGSGLFGATRCLSTYFA
jgi:hypothetical protein